MQRVQDAEHLQQCQLWHAEQVMMMMPWMHCHDVTDALVISRSDHDHHVCPVLTGLKCSNLVT